MGRYTDGDGDYTENPIQAPFTPPPYSAVLYWSGHTAEPAQTMIAAEAIQPDIQKAIDLIESGRVHAAVEQLQLISQNLDAAKRYARDHAEPLTMAVSTLAHRADAPKARPSAR